MNKAYTSVAELLADESFVNYCIHPRKENVFRWEMYINENPEQRSLIEEAKKILSLMCESLEESDLEQQLVKLKAAITAGKEETGVEQHFEKKMSARPVRRIMRIAVAAAAVIIIVVGGYWFLQQQRIKNQIALQASSAQVSYNTYNCKVGDRNTIVLQDGTSIILNSNSTLKVPDNYGEHNRKVLLAGAAFFDVTHNPKKPLTVISGNFATVDIGTSFFVRAYKNEENIKVLLLSGKVKVETNQNVSADVTHSMIELNPGEKVTVNKINGRIQTGAFDVKALDSWKAGRLNFNNASFDDVVKELERWYGVSIKVTGNRRKGLHFTGQFKHEKLDNVLKVISFSMNCKYKINDAEITLQF